MLNNADHNLLYTMSVFTTLMLDTVWKTKKIIISKFDSAGKRLKNLRVVHMKTIYWPCRSPDILGGTSTDIDDKMI